MYCSVSYRFHTAPLCIGDSDTEAIRFRQRQRSPPFCVGNRFTPLLCTFYTPSLGVCGSHAKQLRFGNRGRELALQVSHTLLVVFFGYPRLRNSVCALAVSLHTTRILKIRTTEAKVKAHAIESTLASLVTAGGLRIRSGKPGIHTCSATAVLAE